MPRRSALPWLALLIAVALLLGATAPAALPAQAAPAPQLTAEVPPPDTGRATPAPAVRAAIDQALGDHLAKLLDYQLSLQGQKGGYVQQLASHTTPPADGQLVAPDRLNAGPTDQAEKLADFWQDAKLAPALPYSFRVDVYDGPQGPGYVVTASAILSGQLWERAINTGPETYREQPWTLVLPERGP